MPPTKRAREEGDGLENRFGITRRNSKYVLEMRLSKKIAADLKLQFGSYETVEEAHIGRDYAAYLRDSTGQEDCAAVGGFNPDVHPSIFKFQESPGVFDDLKAPEGSRAHARCAEYKSLLELSKEASKEACKKFCKAAREDIRVAIESFRSRFPQTFPRPPASNHLPNTEPVDGETHRTPRPSSSEVRVLPTPGPEVGASKGEGSTSFIGASSLEVQFSVNLSILQRQLFTAEEISRIEKAAKDAAEDEKEKISQELIDKVLEDLEPCLIEPETIPALE